MSDKPSAYLISRTSKLSGREYWLDDEFWKGDKAKWRHTETHGWAEHATHYSHFENAEQVCLTHRPKYSRDTFTIYQVCPDAVAITACMTYQPARDELVWDDPKPKPPLGPVRRLGQSKFKRIARA